MKRVLPCAALVVLLCIVCTRAAAADAYDGLGASDAAVQRAISLVDLAERAVALARRPVWSDRDPGKLHTPRMTRADAERIEFYKRELTIARLALCQLLQANRNPGTREDLTASYAAPVSRP
jgi:hypothetical protein